MRGAILPCRPPVFKRTRVVSSPRLAAARDETDVALSDPPRQARRRRTSIPCRAGVDRDRAADALDEFAADVEAEARSADTARHVRVDTVELLEDQAAPRGQCPPLSRTATSSRPSPARSASWTRPPSGEYLTAFARRLVRTCCSLSRSAASLRQPAAHDQLEPQPVACMRGVRRPPRSRPPPRRRARSRSRTPASRLAGEQISSIIVARRSDCWAMSASISSKVSPPATTSSRCSVLAAPCTAVSGVRSSCDTVAMKSVFS